MAVVEITESNFEQEVLKASTPVLVDFWAPWCGPCKAIAPVVEEISNDLKGKLKVCKANVDDTQDLAAKYSIMSIPTLLIFKGGKPVDVMIGAMSKDQFMAKIKPQLG